MTMHILYFMARIHAQSYPKFGSLWKVEIVFSKIGVLPGLDQPLPEGYRVCGLNIPHLLFGSMIYPQFCCLWSLSFTNLYERLLKTKRKNNVRWMSAMITIEGYNVERIMYSFLTVTCCLKHRMMLAIYYCMQLIKVY